MSEAMEDKDSPQLKERLKSLGFEATQFEPKVNNRFIVKADGLPSYVVKGIKLPKYCSNSNITSYIELECYNPLALKFEQTAIDFVKQPEVKIKVQILDPLANVDTTWDIVGVKGEVDFGALNWSNEGEANIVYITFEVKNFTVSY